jgi:hypothetical protein
MNGGTRIGGAEAATADRPLPGGRGVRELIAADARAAGSALASRGRIS